MHSSGPQSHISTRPQTFGIIIKTGRYFFLLMRTEIKWFEQKAMASIHWQRFHPNFLSMGHADSWNSAEANRQARGLLMAAVDWLSPEWLGYIPATKPEAITDRS